MARAVFLAPMLLALLLAAACGGGGDADDAGSRQGERRSDAAVFTWESSDGVEIEAELRRGGPDWVLLGHQFTGSRRDWDPMVEGFAARGYTVLTWDFRCHGESGCNTPNDSKRDATQETWREWVAALDYAVANGARRIHAGGASMGGTALIQVAAGRDDIATIFAISSPNRFQGLDALERYDRVTVPMLFIVGAGDKAAPDFSQRYFDRAAGPGAARHPEHGVARRHAGQGRRLGPPRAAHALRVRGRSRGLHRGRGRQQPDGRPRARRAPALARGTKRGAGRGGGAAGR